MTVSTQGDAPVGRLPWASLGLPRWGEKPKVRNRKTRASGFELRRLFHQPELPADVGLNGVGRQPSVRLNDEFFSAEEF